jgi:hypothetical protein
VLDQRGEGADHRDTDEPNADVAEPAAQAGPAIIDDLATIASTEPTPSATSTYECRSPATGHQEAREYRRDDPR